MVISHVAAELGGDPVGPRLDLEGGFAVRHPVRVPVLRRRENALRRVPARRHHHLRAGLQEISAAAGILSQVLLLGPAQYIFGPIGPRPISGNIGKVDRGRTCQDQPPRPCGSELSSRSKQEARPLLL